MHLLGQLNNTGNDMTEQTTLNVSDMPQDWYAFCDDRIVPLGICEDFDEADSKAPGQTHWLFSRDSLKDFISQAQEQLADGSSTVNAPWEVKQSDDNDYLYISRSGYPGEIHVKAESEGFVVDAWRSGDNTECLDSMSIMSSDMEPIDEHEVAR
jgi:hypothetical protein